MIAEVRPRQACASSDAMTAAAAAAVTRRLTSHWRHAPANLESRCHRQTAAMAPEQPSILAASFPTLPGPCAQAQSSHLAEEAPLPSLRRSHASPPPRVQIPIFPGVIYRNLFAPRSFTAALQIRNAEGGVLANTKASWLGSNVCWRRERWVRAKIMTPTTAPEAAKASMISHW